MLNNYVSGKGIMSMAFQVAGLDLSPHTKNWADELEVVYNNNLPVNKTAFLVRKKPVQKVIKRMIDIVLSLMAIIFLAPMLMTVIVMIKLDSAGPAFFKQKRIGQDGKPFYMYKFRSMVADAESKFKQVKDLNETNCIMFKSKQDPRITKIGKFIRKYSIDELPQLFNVLIGNMSLVGPRPPLPREVEQYKNWHHVKFLGKPGITGLWQVSGRSNITDFDKVISLDYEYLRKWSILMDFAIMFKTVPVVLSGDGAG